jgi:hypothetical protein
LGVLNHPQSVIQRQGILTCPVKPSGKVIESFSRILSDVPTKGLQPIRYAGWIFNSPFSEFQHGSCLFPEVYSEKIPSFSIHTPGDVPEGAGSYRVIQIVKFFSRNGKVPAHFQEIGVQFFESQVRAV